MKTGIITLALLISTLASAHPETGRIEILGRGEATAAPEYAAISVSVISLCYDHSRDAKTANAELANTIVSILKKYQRTPNDKVTATGGANQRQTEYLEPDPQGRRAVLCERKWRASNTLTLETASIALVAEIQDKILSAIDKTEELDPTRKAQTYAQLGQPQFSVYPKTMTRLRAEAQAAAWVDGKAQFNGFAAACKFHDPKLISITQPTFNAVPHFELHQAAGAATPIIPDAMKVQAEWKFVWSFEPRETCALR